jgi:hypothetical protein
MRTEVKKVFVAGRGGPQRCETSRLPHFLYNRLTNGGEAGSLMRRPPFNPRKIPGTQFCYRLSRLQCHSAAGRIRSIEKSSNLMRNRTHDLPACSIVPQLTMLPRAPIMCFVRFSKWTAISSVNSINRTVCIMVCCL